MSCNIVLVAFIFRVALTLQRNPCVLAPIKKAAAPQKKAKPREHRQAKNPILADPMNHPLQQDGASEFAAGPGLSRRMFHGSTRKGADMYISPKASMARQREAQKARDNRAEIVKALGQGQITRRDLY